MRFKSSHKKNTTSPIISIIILASIMIITVISALLLYENSTSVYQPDLDNDQSSLAQTISVSTKENKEKNPLGLTIPNLDDREARELEEQTNLLDEIINELHSSGQSSQKLIQIMDSSKELLPHKKQMRELSDSEVHMLPYPVANAGEWLISLKEFISNHPQKVDEVLPYYMECADNDDYVDTIRALCLTHFILIHEQNYLEYELDLHDYPENIQDLVESALSF